MSPNSSSSGILWTGRDPRNQTVQIKSETWFNKIAKTPDRKWLLFYLDTVKATLVDPRFITMDATHENREHYVDLFYPEEFGHIMGIVIVTEQLTNGSREFVTVVPKSELRQEKGSVLYERPRPTI